MKKNIIFCFTGTGNSYRVARDISVGLIDCEVYPMNIKNIELLKDNYERIGFIFPVYYQGLPIQVKLFVENISLKKSINTYLFAIATCGRLKGNALSEIYEILAKNNIILNYVNHGVMGDNAIALYNAKGTTEQIEAQYNIWISQFVLEIRNRKTLIANKSSKLLAFYNKYQLKKVPTSDFNFEVSDLCTSCGLCEKLCPVNNIMIYNKKPKYNHTCQQCMACIQNCPSKAIDYKNRTKNRQRYLSPSVSINDLIQFKNRLDSSFS
ncbi:EFR1 family ferrodoxin [Acetobacterium wieringae]|uniref:EFR1 family ferrodoxin n=1 Tax=Acetobacterium wieringae TaxID=52694 RepID=UPI0026ECA256|nr:EFR1 family ferrodoxin [Acetobacterium wieringae]